MLPLRRHPLEKHRVGEKPAIRAQFFFLLSVSERLRVRYLGDLGSSLSIQVVPTKVVRLPMDEEQHPAPPPLYSSILFRIQFLELLGENKKEMEKKFGVFFS